MSQDEYDALKQIAHRPVTLHGDVGLPGSSAPPMRVLAGLQSRRLVTRMPNGRGDRLVITQRGREVLGTQAPG